MISGGEPEFHHQPPTPPLSPAAASVGAIATRRRLPGSSPRPSNSAPDAGLEMAAPRPPKIAAGFLEDFLVISGLVAVQVVTALYMVLLKPILSLGITPLFLIISGSLTTAFFIFPFSIALEMKKWPSRLSLILVVQFILIAAGVTAYQALMFVGIKKTSPSIASAMPNLAPGIIFAIAACLRLEKVKLNCKYSRTKILGTMVCLAGAVSMSLIQSPDVVRHSQRQSVMLNPLKKESYNDWVIGCSCLLGGVFILSCSTVLQAATMIEFPTPFSLCVVTSLLGAVLTSVLQIITEGKLGIGQPAISIQAIIAIVFLGGMVIALCVAFQTWAVLRKGPVIVSMFSPIQTVCSMVLSAMILGQVIKFGSVAGMLAMFFGLYMVLWAKKKEEFVEYSEEESPTQSSDEDIESPLLT